MSARSLHTLIEASGGTQVPALGFIVWWNVRGVEIDRDWWRERLNEIGLNGEKYARDHNFRSAFIRCLRSLEQQRIIRKVTEDHTRLVYQFTAERLNDSDPDNPMLEYERESSIEIDKEIYWLDGDFSAAVVKCDPPVKATLVELFEKERRTYRSSDLTRYVQKIFNDQADLVSLRPQGAVYFVPAAYQSLIVHLSGIMARVPVGEATLEFIPVPDVDSARTAVGRGVESELTEGFAKMEEEISQMMQGSAEITEKWVAHRQQRIGAIQNRIKRYAELLGETGERLSGKFDALKETLKPRVLEV